MNIFNLQKGSLMKKISLIIALCGAMCSNYTPSLFADILTPQQIQSEAEAMVNSSMPMKQRNKRFEEYIKSNTPETIQSFFHFYAQARLDKWIKDGRGKTGEEETSLYKATIMHLVDVAQKLGLLTSRTFMDLQTDGYNLLKPEIISNQSIRSRINTGEMRETLSGLLATTRDILNIIANKRFKYPHYN